MTLYRLLVSVAALSIAVPASADWHLATTRHFNIYSDQEPAAVRAYAEKLERFDSVVRKLRNMKDRPVSAANKLTIYAVRDNQEIEKIYGAQGVGGFYHASASGSVAFVPQEVNTRVDIGEAYRATADQVFFHEYAHHLQFQDARVALPMWMSEGFAEFYGYAQFRPDGSIVIGAPANARSRSLAADDLPVETMLTGSKDLYLHSPSLFYGKSWLLTHYLAFDKSRSGQLSAYIKAIQSGSKPLDAARGAFGDLKKLDSELWRYKRGNMSQMVIPANAVESGPIAIRPLRPGEAAVMAARMRSERGVHKGSANAVLAKAKRDGAPYMTDPYVLGVISEAAFDAKDYDGTISVADRALALDAKNIQAIVYKGRALMEQARKTKSAPLFDQARAQYRKALAIDEEAAEPIVLMYRSYKEQGIAVPNIDFQALMFAHMLVPQDDELRALVTQEMLKQGDFEGAKQTFATLAFNPHLRGKGKVRADKIMDAIETKNAAAALAVFAELDAEAEKERA